MIWIVTFLLAAAGASALLLAAFTVLRLAGRTVSARAIRRSAVMTAAWSIAGLSLHWAFVSFPSFARSVPTGLLMIDVGRPWYGRIAAALLHDRALALGLSASQCDVVTDRLLAHPWWLPHEPAAAPGFDPRDPVTAWLDRMLHSQQLTPAQWSRWINLDPPPLADSVEGGAVRFTWGREWQRRFDVPYEVEQVHIVGMSIDGRAVEYAMTLTGNPSPDLGRYANVMECVVSPVDSSAPAADESDHTVVVEIRYTLDLEPGAVSGLGPFTWRRTVNVKATPPDPPRDSSDPDR